MSLKDRIAAKQATAPQAPQADQLAQLLAALTPQQPQLTAEDIAEIVNEELTKKAPPVVRIKLADMPEHEVANPHPELKNVLTWLANGENVWLAGPAGSGKTTMARQAAEALGRPFGMTGAIMTKHELIGFKDAHGNYHSTPLREAYEHGHLFLFDEIDGCDPRAVVAFNALLDGGESYAFPDGIVKRHPNFIAIGAANTFGHGASRQYVGRFQMDAASLDRFVQIPIDYSPEIDLAAAGGNQLIVDEARRLRDLAATNNVNVIISPRVIKRVALGGTFKQLLTPSLTTDAVKILFKKGA